MSGPPPIGAPGVTPRDALFTTGVPLRSRSPLRMHIPSNPARPGDLVGICTVIRASEGRSPGLIDFGEICRSGPPYRCDVPLRTRMPPRSWRSMPPLGGGAPPPHQGDYRLSSRSVTGPAFTSPPACRPRTRPASAPPAHRSARTGARRPPGAAASMCSAGCPGARHREGDWLTHSTRVRRGARSCALPHRGRSAVP